MAVIQTIITIIIIISIIITVVKIVLMAAFGSHDGFISTQRESTKFVAAANL